ncbi:hypothetical protein [Pseudactinotalea terrae]|uniref:hypothetical protein n=1 Tax=Pseudactinotalea terrae TaxID=1743262 RepID=UPI0012E1AC4B|nr:hypothetical protein [Pseudactinotalea terrae]
MTQRRRLASLALAGAVLLGAGSVASAPPAAAAVTIGDVVVSPIADGLEDGFGRLVVEVSLQSSESIPDEIFNGVHNDVLSVQMERVDDAPWVTSSERPPQRLGWYALTRVSGTATDGVWRASITATPWHTGTWQVTQIETFAFDAIDVSDRGLVVELGDPAAGPQWVVQPVFGSPVKVVTGNEMWTPQARVTDRSDGTAVRAPWLPWRGGDPFNLPQSTLPSGTPLQQADATGYLALPAARVVGSEGELDRPVIHVYGRYGSRGYSWQAATTLFPYVKWQANSRFAVSGRTVTVTGNAWPAPSVYDAANTTIYLQRLVSGTWVTVATGHVRETGRYTMTWTGPAGQVTLRVYKPGGSANHGLDRSEGTKLASTTLVLR